MVLYEVETDAVVSGTLSCCPYFSTDVEAFAEKPINDTNTALIIFIHFSFEI